MQSELVNAIVLSCHDYGERDLILSLFTLEHGRIKAFAKGARNSVKRFGGRLEPANCIEAIIVIRDESMSILKSSEISVCHTSILSRLESLATAIYACELIDLLAPEGHPVPRLFRLLATLIEYLDQNNASMSDRRFFEINLLNIMGYRPEIPLPELQTLKDCLRTGKFGIITFTKAELKSAGRILDSAIALHTNRTPKSLNFINKMLEQTT